ncbi:unnamed protein product [Brassicogethes aeneus]|uniref:Uncharacterized protein n=1 Tax=Brassicogethes aeneus TaxID=1431903 RepID=A0A9P0B036_BRAAE|nr:unnamed protein product [Brassicogethes aeneus]
MSRKIEEFDSPHGRIGKEIISPGLFGSKPIENSICDINHVDLNESIKITIGQQDSDFGRILDVCIPTMSKGETSKFTVKEYSFTLLLHSFTEGKYIYQLTPEDKYNLALKHKDVGVDLFKNNRNKDAASRFSKALKYLHSIPIDVAKKPVELDGILVKDINTLKGTLYNNLASCYFKNQSWTLVIDICNRVINYDKDNVKALYKLGVSYKHDKNYEKSYESFKRVLELEPNNKACGEHLKFVESQLKESQKNINDLVKRMFVA